MGYLVSPYSYTNGAAGGLPVSMVCKRNCLDFFLGIFQDQRCEYPS